MFGFGGIEKRSRWREGCALEVTGVCSRSMVRGVYSVSSRRPRGVFNIMQRTTAGRGCTERHQPLAVSGAWVAVCVRFAFFEGVAGI